MKGLENKCHLLSMMAKELEGCKEKGETSKLWAWKLGNGNRYLHELRHGETVSLNTR